MKKNLLAIAILFFFAPRAGRLIAQSRPDKKVTVYIDQATGNRVSQHYVDSLNAIGTVAVPDSIRVIDGVSYYYIHLWDTSYLFDVTKAPVYRKTFGRNIYTSPGVFAGYKQLNKDSLMGKVCLVDFWATTCGPCVRGMAEFDSVFSAYLSHRQIEILHFTEENDTVVGKFLNKYSARHFAGRFINSADSLFSEYAIMGLPTLLIVDKTGVVVKVFIGQGSNLSKIQAAVRDALN